MTRINNQYDSINLSQGFPDFDPPKQLLDALAETLRRQVELLERELRTTAQRVNLFEKVKIPEAKENIRVIGIYLGDQQTSAVVRGKIAKKKLQEVSP